MSRLKGTYVGISGTYTISPADGFVNCTSGTFTATLPPVTNAPNAVYFVWNSGAGTLTLDGDGAEQINGAGTLTVNAGEFYVLANTGTAWVAKMLA